ncbi:transposable element Tcb2 transposase [Trichonephila clavipes]|nr:transposable element Tcb2 transposase [Trichonephila clavipes]
MVMRIQISGTKRHRRHEFPQNTCGRCAQLNTEKVGTRFHSSNITERGYCGVSGVAVWEGIMLNGWNDFNVFNRGSVTRYRYCKEVILPQVCLFQGVIGPDFIFMDDNVWPHRTADIQQLESEHITRTD